MKGLGACLGPPTSPGTAPLGLRFVRPGALPKLYVPSGRLVSRGSTVSLRMELDVTSLFFPYQYLLERVSVANIVRFTNNQNREINFKVCSDAGCHAVVRGALGLLARVVVWDGADFG